MKPSILGDWHPPLASGMEKPMRTIRHLLGHGAGFAGVMIAIGSILRAIPFGLLRFLPFTHGLTTLWIGGPLSIALVALAAVILGGGDSGG